MPCATLGKALSLTRERREARARSQSECRCRAEQALQLAAPQRGPAPPLRGPRERAAKSRPKLVAAGSCVPMASPWSLGYEAPLTRVGLLLKSSHRSHPLPPLGPNCSECPRQQAALPAQVDWVPPLHPRRLAVEALWLAWQVWLLLAETMTLP